MRALRSHLVSVRIFLIAAAFGCAALLVILANFHLRVLGTNIVTDPREFFVLIGAAITGPVGGIIIGILSGLGDPRPDLHYYIVAQHVFGAVWIGWAYKHLVHDRMHMPRMLLAWVAVVFVYYFVCPVPVIAATRYLFPDFFATILPGSLTLSSTLMVFYRGWLLEFILTTVLTSAVLLVLPRSARVPMWWTVKHPKVFMGLRQRPPRSILALRLTVWFLILSYVPLVIMAVFLRNTLTGLYVERIAEDELETLHVFRQWLEPPGAVDQFVPAVGPFLHDPLHVRMILDENGRIMSHPDSTQRYADARRVYGRSVVEAILQQDRGYVSDENTGRCFIFLRMNERPHKLVAILDTDVGTALLKSFERTTLIRLGVALVLVSTIAGLVIWLIIGRPIRSLANAARRVGRNDLQVRVDPEMMSDEVGILGMAFNEMTENLAILHRGLQTEIEDRRSTEEALRESERRFREMSDLLPQTVYEVDLAGKFLFANRAAFAMFGYDADSVIPGLTVMDFVAPEERDRAREGVQRLYEGINKASTEYILQRADGSKFPGLIYSSVVREGSRVCGMRGIIIDISEQRRVEQVLRNAVTEKELMLKEIHHRVKNNLQIISSLLSLQASSIRDPFDLSLFAQSVDRIRSMALIHDRLYKSQDLAGIEFREYIESLVMSLFHSYGHPDVACRADVQDVRLSIDTAIPCGLIINELVTNALKHAFPERRRGVVTVALVSLENGDVELSVADDGVGFPPDVEIKKAASLGLQLVQILSDQLQATLDIRQGNGTTISIRVPHPPAPQWATTPPDDAAAQGRNPS